MKHFIKNFLKERNVYEYLKYSWLFRMYEYLFKPQVIRQHRKEVRLYQSFLPSCNLVFDIGAYDGHKTAAFLELANQVVCCEPDPFNFRVLKIRFRNSKRVQLHQVALAEKEGEETYFVHHKGSAFNTLNPDWKRILEEDPVNRWNEKIRFDDADSIKVVTTTLDALIAKYGLPEFIKIDVEGYEQEVLMGLSQPPHCLSFECLLPEFRAQLLSILERLIRMEPAYTFNIIYYEELVLKDFVGYTEILEWIEKTELYTFDMVAKVRG